MKVAIGSDHRGYISKQKLITLLQQKGYGIQDFGTYNTDSCDYPEIAKSVGKAVAEGTADSGVLVCGTGIGMSIVANKIPGVRAARVVDPMDASLARKHNDANVMCLSEVCPLTPIFDLWFETEFEGGRHTRRVEQIDAEILEES